MGRFIEQLYERRGWHFRNLEPSSISANIAHEHQIRNIHHF